jgi:hypothetical protein
LDPSSADPIRRRQDASSYSDTVEPLDIVTPPASDVARAIIYGVPLPTDRPVTTIQTNPYVAKYRIHQIETLAHGLSSPMENRLGFSYYRRRASAGRLSNIERHVPTTTTSPTCASVSFKRKLRRWTGPKRTRKSSM